MRKILSAAFAALVVALATGARADSCQRVNAAIVTNYVFNQCASPVGICTAGVVLGGVLGGTTYFTALTLAPTAAGSPLWVYSGNLLIRTHRGTLTISDEGLFDFATGAYFEMQQVLRGTGYFAGAWGAFTSQGRATSTGFSGMLSGSVCREFPRSRFTPKFEPEDDGVSDDE